jgi:hypothetical protein
MRTDEQILAGLERAAAGLFYMSESDYPLETVCFEIGEKLGHERLRELAGCGENARVEVRSLEDFFRDGRAVELPRGGGTARPASFQSLVRLLRENLTDVKVYKVGEINIPVLVLGRSASGRWLGVSTRVVET